jgi:GYF domain 2
VKLARALRCLSERLAPVSVTGCPPGSKKLPLGHAGDTPASISLCDQCIVQLAMTSTVQAPAAQPAGAAWFYLGLSSERLGPFSQAAMVDLISKGTLDPNALAWTEGQGEWQPIASLPPFRDAAEVIDNISCLLCIREARSLSQLQSAPPCLAAQLKVFYVCV